MPTAGQYSRYTGGGGFMPVVAFTPLLLAGLVAWYKADTGVTESGGAVSQWDDQSGNNWHLTQATGSMQPTFSATSFNGKPGITFDGVAGGDHLLNTSITSFSGATNTSGFLVAKRNGTGDNNPRWLTLRNNADSNDYDNARCCIYITENAATLNIRDTRNFANYNSTAITNATNYRLGSIFEPSQVTLYVNNVATGPASDPGGTFSSPGTIVVGAGVEGGSIDDEASVTVAEVIITTSALGSTDRLSLDNYFRNKWGL